VLELELRWPLVRLHKELISGGLSVACSTIPTEPRGVGQPLRRYSGSLRRISLRGAPSGASLTAPRQAVIGVGIDLEVEVEVKLDLIAFAFLFQGPFQKFIGLCCNFFIF
jgi:hypothetical protein